MLFRKVFVAARNITEQRPARLVHPAPHHPRRYRAEGESCSQIGVEAGLFQRPANAAPITGAISSISASLRGTFGHNVKQNV